MQNKHLVRKSKIITKVTLTKNGSTMRTNTEVINLEYDSEASNAINEEINQFHNDVLLAVKNLKIIKVPDQTMC